MSNRDFALVRQLLRRLVVKNEMSLPQQLARGWYAGNDRGHGRARRAALGSVASWGYAQ